MKNPILEALNRNASTVQDAPAQNNPLQMIQKFAEFKQQMRGKNPEAIVKGMLSSGEMTAGQFEQLKQQASMLRNILK